METIIHGTNNLEELTMDIKNPAIKEIESTYTRSVAKKIFFLLFLVLVLAGLMGVAIGFGVIELSFAEVCYVLLNRVFPDHFHVSEIARKVVWDIRLPRVLFGIFSGAGLGMAGAVMQVVLKNPLASPYTLGISSAAGFGAALAILTGNGFLGNYLVAGNAFIFALISSFVIVGVSGLKGTSSETMILTGIAIMYLFSACTTLMEYFADPEAVKGVVFWMVGNLGKASWEKLTVLLSVLAVCIPVLIWKSWDLNLIASGDEAAKSLGIEVEGLRNLSLIIVSLLVACIVAFTGTIGFVGLVAPHVTRMIIGGDNKFTLPGSALMGGILLTGADIFSRHMMPPVILPIGVMTSFMGIPLFFFLIIKRRKRYW